MFRSVGGNGKRCREVGKVENWFRQKEGFESVERGLAGGSPIPLEIFLCEVDEGTSDI